MLPSGVQIAKCQIQYFTKFKEGESVKRAKKQRKTVTKTPIERKKEETNLGSKQKIRTEKIQIGIVPLKKGAIQIHGGSCAIRICRIRPHAFETYVLRPTREHPLERTGVSAHAIRVPQV